MPNDLRYPIGKFTPPATISAADRNKYIAEIAKLPLAMKTVVEPLSEEQLDTPYREGGWTVRQLVHHMPDSHLNSYIRFKWALTENQPVIKAYHEDRWAELPDTQHTPVAISLQLLEALHQRWVILLKNLKEEDWEKFFVHPETRKNIRLDTAVAMYAWHGNHHLAHINHLRERMQW